MISVHTVLLNYLSPLIHDYFILFLLKCIVIHSYYNLVVMKFCHSVIEYVLLNYRTNVIDQVC